MRESRKTGSFLFYGFVFAIVSIALSEPSHAQACGTGTCGGGETCISDTGVLTTSTPSCLLLEGPGFPFPGPYALQNLGGFSAGDEVTIEGCASAYFGACFATFFVSNNTIELVSPPVPALTESGQLAIIVATSAVAVGALLRGRRFKSKGCVPASRRR